MCNICIELYRKEIYNCIYNYIAITANMQLITFRLKKDYKTLLQAFL